MLLPSYIAGLALISAILFSFWLESSPRLVISNVPGSVGRGSTEYQRAVTDHWKKSPLNHVKFLVNTGSFSANIQNQFHELQEVWVRLPLLGSTPTIVLIPAKPALVLVSEGKPYYISSSGKVMAPVSDMLKNDLKNLAVISDDTGMQATAGKYVLSGSYVDFLAALQKQLTAEGLEVQSIILPAGAVNQVDVRLAGQQYYIKFQFDTDPRQAVGSYLAAKARLEAEKSSITQYVDVRVEEKIFYR